MKSSRKSVSFGVVTWETLSKAQYCLVTRRLISERKYGFREFVTRKMVLEDFPQENAFGGWFVSTKMVLKGLQKVCHRRDGFTARAIFSRRCF